MIEIQCRSVLLVWGWSFVWLNVPKDVNLWRVTFNFRFCSAGTVRTTV